MSNQQESLIIGMIKELKADNKVEHKEIIKRQDITNGNITKLKTRQLYLRGVLIGAGVVLLILGNSIGTIFNSLNEMILFIETDMPPPLGVLFYSTYFTSVWFYLFIISSIGAKVIYSFGHFGNTIMDFFGVQKTPFQSMGTIAMILVTVCFVIYAVINTIG